MLNELYVLAKKLREEGDFSKAYELSEVIFKLKIIVRDKFIKLNYNERFDYFDKLHCEISHGIFPSDDDKHILIFIKLNRQDFWYVLMPVDVAEKVLIFGMP